MRLKHLGIHGLSRRHFYTSALNAADFLCATDPQCTVFAVGEGGLLAALHERKIPNDTIRPHYVVVGEGAISMEKLSKAHECIERGARLLATNPDNWCPVTSEQTRPGAGATAVLSGGQHGAAGVLFGQAQRLYVPAGAAATGRHSRPRRPIKSS